MAAFEGLVGVIGMPLHGIRRRPPISQQNPRPRAWAEVLQRHVHFLHHLEAELDTFRTLQVNGYASLATVKPQKECGCIAKKGRSPLASDIAGIRRFQL